MAAAGAEDEEKTDPGGVWRVAVIANPGVTVPLAINKILGVSGAGATYPSEVLLGRWSDRQ